MYTKIYFTYNIDLVVVLSFCFKFFFDSSLLCNLVEGYNELKFITVSVAKGLEQILVFSMAVILHCIYNPG